MSYIRYTKCPNSRRRVSLRVYLAAAPSHWIARSCVRIWAGQNYSKSVDYMIISFIYINLQLVNRAGKQFVPLHGIYPVPVWISLVNVLPQPHRKLAVRISWPWSVARSSICWRSAPSVWPIQLKISAVQRIN